MNMQVTPLQGNAALRHFPVLAEERGYQFGPARAHQASDAQDFAPPDVEAYPTQHLASGFVGIVGVQVFDFEENRTRPALSVSWESMLAQVPSLSCACRITAWPRTA